MKNTLGMFLVLVGLAMPGPTMGAESKGFSANTFQITPGHDSFVTVEGATVKDRLSLRVGMLMDYQYRPLVGRVCETSNGGECDVWGDDVPILSHRLIGNFFAGVSFLKLAEVGVVVPVILYQTGEDAQSPSGEKIGSPSNASGMEDVRLHLKLDILRGIFGYDGGKIGLNLALVPSVTFPVGNALSENSFMGDDFLTFHPMVAIGGEIGRVRMGFNVGYVIVKEKETYFAKIGSRLSYGLATEVDIISNFSLLAELFGKQGFSSDTASQPLEGVLAAKYKFGPGFEVMGGVGIGIIDGLGTPPFRGFAGLSWIPMLPSKSGADTFVGTKDKDMDGIADELDRCPLAAEDKDGYQDEDGCPDEDNDNDGVLDGYDTCPNEAEDKDAFDDDDGCPDRDNDRDGISDITDGCPGQPEIFNGTEDEDGCPDEGDELARISEMRIDLLRPVIFKSRKSAQLKDDASRRVLDVVATLLTLNTDIKVRIEAHSDKKAGQRRNLKITQKQAETVRRYLAQKKISAERLEAVGRGSSQPLYDDSKIDPSSSNWRIEFHIVDGTKKAAKR